jgi:hypothetical protein
MANNSQYPYRPKKTSLYRVFAALLGSGYIVFSLFGLLMVYFQKYMFDFMEDLPSQNGDEFQEEFYGMLSIMHDIFYTYLPWLAFIGVLYILISIFTKKMKLILVKVNKAMMILPIIWMTFYSIATKEYFDVFFGFFAQGAPFPIEDYILPFLIINIIVCYAVMFAGPQIFLIYSSRGYVRIMKENDQ